MTAIASTICERAVAGSILVDAPTILPICRAEGLTAADFFSAENRLVYEAAVELFDAGRAVDAIGVAEQLQADGHLDDVHGVPGLHQMMEEAQTETGVRDSIRKIKQRAARRRMAERLERLHADLRDPTVTDNDIDAELWEMTRGNVPDDDCEILPAWKMAELYPELSEPIVDGLIRRGEIGNVISTTKIGKSWLALEVAFSVEAGEPFIGFRCKRGRVLYVDNELAKKTLSYRFRTVAAAHGRDWRKVNGIDLLSLRDKPMDLHALEAKIRRMVDTGNYDLIILDAFYRFFPVGASENDNAQVAALYNVLNRIAAQTDAAVLLIHHSTKGGQSDKRTTDVGAGAGSQSRAADLHLILREHDQGAEFAVLDAAVRSFAPVQSVTIRWEFPRWFRDEDVAPELKRQASRGELTQNKKDREGCEAIVKAFARSGQSCLTISGIRKHSGMGHDRTTRLVNLLVDGDALKIHHADDMANGERAIYYSLQNNSEGIDDVEAA